ncbi:MAG: radical SAM protein [Methanocorpusculum sp.]|nr:radical SAM protein [Methanocorpusculum sp.]
MHFIQAKSLLSSKNGMNIFRGCTHGCIYCDSRSLCYQMPHAFSDVAVKENAPSLLDAALSRKRKKGMIGFGSMSDPYIPAESSLRLTRQCLEIIARRGFGVSLITKSDQVLRDIDLLKEIQERAKAVVSVTLTTADDALCRKIEPNVCPTSRRAEVLYALQDAGIPTVVWLCPILPYINDTKENLEGIL